MHPPRPENPSISRERERVSSLLANRQDVLRERPPVLSQLPAAYSWPDMFSQEGRMPPADWDRARAPSVVQPLWQDSPLAHRVFWLRGTARARSPAVFPSARARAEMLRRTFSPPDRDRPTEQRWWHPVVR